MGRRSQGGPPALQLAKEYLLANKAATNEDVVKALGVSSRTVTAARSALISMGLLQRSYFDRTSSHPTPDASEPAIPHGPTLETHSVADLAKLNELIQQDHGEAITAEEARKRVSRIIRAASVMHDPQLELSAINMFARLDAQLGARDRLGPGPPLSREAKVQRSSQILEAIGPSIAGEALTIAFDRKQIDSLLSAIAGGMVRKAKNEQPATENPSQDPPNQPPASAEAVETRPDVAELGPERDADGAGDEKPVAGGSESTGGG